MTSVDIEAAREAYRQQRWSQAFARLSDPKVSASLGFEDLRRLAIAAHMLGRPLERQAAGERAYRAALDEGDLIAAATSGILAGLWPRRVRRGRPGRWLVRPIRRAPRADRGADRRRGLPPAPGGTRQPEGRRDCPGARGLRGDRRDRPTVRRSRPRGDLPARPRRLPDPVGPEAGGDRAASTKRCSRSHPARSLRRSSASCTARRSSPTSRPSTSAGPRSGRPRSPRGATPSRTSVPFRGRCMVYRSELMVLHGQWDDAADEVRRARERLLGPPIGTGRSATRTTSRPSWTGSAGRSAPRPRATVGPPSTAARPNPAWPSSASRRVGRRLPSPRSVGRWTRRSTR